MIYAFLTLSLAVNGLAVWYIQKLLKKYVFATTIRDEFAVMLGQYADSLEAIYKLEEFYGEETLKRAISQTRFVEEACREYQKIISEVETTSQAQESGQGEEATEEGDEEGVGNGPIRLKEGERITQDAASYRRVVPTL